MNKKIKIGFLTFPELLFRSGEATVSGSILMNNQIIRALEHKGFEVIKFCPKDPKRFKLRSIVGLGNALMFQDLIKQIDKINKCDVIISTNYFGLIMPEIKKPIITIFHHSAQSILKVLNSDVCRDNNFLKWLKSAEKDKLLNDANELTHSEIAAIIEQRAIDLSTKVVAVSGDLGQEMLKSYDLSPKKLVVINNTFVDDHDILLSEKNFNNQLNLISVSRAPDSETGFMLKGIDRICEIFSKDVDYQKTLVVSADNKNKYKKFFNRNLPKTKIVFNLEHQQVYNTFFESHISIHCSRLESFGLTLIESMLMGNVPIVFPVGVSEEIIENGKNGFIVKDVNEISKLLKIINSKDFRPKLAKMSEEARKTVLKKIDPDQTYEKYSNLVKSIVG